MYVWWTGIILNLEGDSKHVPVKEILYVLCRRSFHFVSCISILEKDFPVLIKYHVLQESHIWFQTTLHDWVHVSIQAF